MRTLALAAHDPINIDGNAGFTNASGVVWGSGTASDPYIIADWDITPSTTFGILIQQTDAHFMIRNCYVHDGSSNGYTGILLNYCINGTLENNTFLNDWEGILLISSSRNMLSNNNCSLSVGNSISLVESSNNTLINNICSNNEYGLSLYYSNDNTLSNNNCSSNNHDGIGFRLSSNNNEMSRNRVCNNALYGVNISSGSDNHIWNNTFIGNNGAGTTYNPGHIQAYDDGTNNRWNSLGYGNYWSDWTTPDLDFDGIVDNPYLLDGGAGAKDYYPLTTPQAPIPEFGLMPFVVMVLLVVIVLTMGARRRKA